MKKILVGVLLVVLVGSAAGTFDGGTQHLHAITFGKKKQPAVATSTDLSMLLCL